jgi:chemotaxis protein CheC
MDLRTLNVVQLDGLREVANIGAAHAATALSQITETRVRISVPDVRLLRLTDAVTLLDDDPAGVVITLDVLGDLSGWMLQLFPEASASHLVDSLLGRRLLEDAARIRELELSAVQEVANIMAGSSLNALSEFLGLTLSMSPARLDTAAPSSVLATLRAPGSSDDDLVFCMSTRITLADAEAPLVSDLLFAPDRESVGVLLNALRLA